MTVLTMMIQKVVIQTLSFFSSLFYGSLLALGAFLIFFGIMFLVGLVRVRFKLGKFPKKISSHKKRRSLFARLFLDFPFRYFSDVWSSAESNAFPYHGLWLFVGEQGSGKTTTMTFILNYLHKLYPDCACFTNYNFSDLASVSEPESLSYLLGGRSGTIFAIDELQNWFSSNSSKDFPPEYLEFFTQLRKSRCVTMGTSQVFSRVSKPLREQVRYVFAPRTLFGCLTICGVFRPDILNSSDGSVAQLRRIKTFCFVHSDELRSLFDTGRKISYKIIKKKKE